MTEDYIRPQIKPNHKDRTIRTIYLPIEVRNMILEAYKTFTEAYRLNYGERALLADFSNYLIMELKNKE